MSDPTQTQGAAFAVDSNACLGIGKGDARIQLEPAEVVQLLDFLTAITYKTLAQRANSNPEGATV
jgi:hypothetical protein